MNIQPPSSKAANLRPRNRRLISIDDDFQTLDTDTSPGSTSLQSTASSIFPSRAASPIPSTHPSRAASTNRNTQRTQQNGQSPSNLRLEGYQVRPNAFSTGLWENSWSSLQGLASSLLGSDTQRSSKDKSRANFLSPRKKQPLEAAHRGLTRSSAPDKWGPSANLDKQIASGSKEDRLAQVQAKKREALLASDGNTLADGSGKFKRRFSNEGVEEPHEHNQDVLVYLHHVQPNDTLAGVTIKYNCSAATIHKANRLWPNDSIQIRKLIYLPVDACGVRGRKIESTTQEFDLLSDNEGSSDLTPTPTPTFPGQNPYRTQDNPKNNPPPSSHATSPSISTTNTDNPDPPWKHDCWVMLPNHGSPVQIARLSRQTLGYFPPSRRKSISYADDLSSPIVSRASSKSPPMRPYHSQTRQGHTSRGSSGSYFVQSLKGPGGVGTLGHEVRNPGPAQDRLNKLFAGHLPNVAPRSSFESATSTSSHGIENVGGAIEGWVRKFAGNVAGAMRTPPLRGRSTGATSQGDLIELMDSFDLDGASDEGGRRLPRDEGVGMGQEDRERELRERFPPRGRVFSEEGKRK
ncbi:hypothetical protein MMC14_008444 [Varicellaria rhodocarpa]|nr:hypothetical protein [Varicellaria rhodocarpa]